MKQLKKVLTLNYLATILVLLGCTNSSFDPPNKRIEKEKNTCLPAAILLKESLKKYNIWGQVITFTWLDKNKKQHGHAYCFYEYPKNSNQLWSYCNNWGSFKSTFTKKQILQNLLEANYHRKIFGNIVEYQVLD